MVGTRTGAVGVPVAEAVEEELWNALAPATIPRVKMEEKTAEDWDELEKLKHVTEDADAQVSSGAHWVNKSNYLSIREVLPEGVGAYVPLSHVKEAY